MSNKTSDLISQLATDLKPRSSADSTPTFIAKWALAAAGVLTAWLVLIPHRSDLSLRAETPLFIASSLLWFALSAVSALIVYRNRIPSLKSQGLQRTAYALMVVLLGSILVNPIRGDFSRELSLEDGLCGPLIFSMALTWGAALFWWARNGAATALPQTGAWIAVSSGCFAAFAMQAICAHENTLHLLIWHTLPIVGLVSIGAYAGKRWLRW